MFQVVKYRYHYIYYPGSSGWYTTSKKTFQHIFDHLPDRVLNIDVRIYKQISGYSIADAEYKLVDAWDWLRAGVVPAADLRLMELAKKNPSRYKFTTKGIWCRRLDLINLT